MLADSLVIASLVNYSLFFFPEQGGGRGCPLEFC